MTENRRLSADAPLTNPSDDRLGYSTFAQRLADALCKMAPADGLVVAVYGPWGSGKTTLLNFVEHYVSRMPQDDRPEVLHFNPWWFAGSEDLARRFFEQLTNSLDPKDKSLTKIRKGFSDMADVIAGVPIPHAGLARIPAWVIRPKAKSLHELQSNLRRLLQSRNRRFLIFIDDIDRLTLDEIRQLFLVVKAVANLPNLVYLLAFDKRVVTDALAKFHEASGSEYLEKIVQLPFDLPLPDKPTVRRLLFAKLDEALGNLDENAFDQQYWANVYFDGIDTFVETPRDVMRLTNAIAVAFPPVRDEVNPVDFIAIEALRVFAPCIYDTIRVNRDEFTGVSGGRFQQGQGQLAFHDGYLQDIDEPLRESAKALLQRLFPRLQSVWGKVHYTIDSQRDWTRRLRVCSPDVFPVYFRLELSEGAIGAADIRRFLQISKDSSAISNELRSMSQQMHGTGMTRANALLQRLECYTHDEIPQQSVLPILRALFDVGDELRQAEPERRGFYEFGIDTQIGRIVFQLLGRLPETQVFAVVAEAIQNGRAVTTITDEIVTLGQGLRKHPNERSPITLDRLVELEALMAERIGREAESGGLIHVPNLAPVLGQWKQWQKGQECESWIESMKASPDFIVALLDSLVGLVLTQGIGWSAGTGDRVAKRSYRINLEFLRTFLSPEDIEPIVVQILEQRKLSDRERRALNVFLDASKNPRQSTEWPEQ